MNTHKKTQMSEIYSDMEPDVEDNGTNPNGVERGRYGAYLDTLGFENDRLSLKDSADLAGITQGMAAENLSTDFDSF